MFFYRPVTLYRVPKVNYISYVDVEITFNEDMSYAYIRHIVNTYDKTYSYLEVRIFDQEGNLVYFETDGESKLNKFLY